ncbi:lmo0954 family membrane protein [Pontibacillus litoralis]|uniref:Permease n=1 Tax=Pontibacillus litoralis JSM 072002 TaxID=1385512 RepID=A0A0A5G6P2_9BACI|nr:flagellar basal body rod protein [Pontibacillus litoralis]KGX86838.1 permease [Pontibacillus litoralis JSM 072002]
MKQFLWFIGSFIALTVLVVHFIPMVFLIGSVWLLYAIFKQFMKSSSTFKRVLWIMIALMVFCIAIANIYAVIGIAAAYFLYIAYKKWRERKQENVLMDNRSEDPFVHFEKQWAELNK